MSRPDDKAPWWQTTAFVTVAALFGLWLLAATAGALLRAIG